MGRPLRCSSPWQPTEITARTIHGRYLLRPSKKVNELILGIIGRAQTMHDVELYGVVVLSNHIHLVMSAKSSSEQSNFLRYVLGNIAREIGKLHSWRDKFWARRHRAIPILDDIALDERMRYLLGHSVKEGLVADPVQWPGVHSVAALCSGSDLFGIWYDRTAQYQAKKSGTATREKDFGTRYDVVLSPIPKLRAESTCKIQRYYRQLTESAKEEAVLNLSGQRRQFVGRRQVLRHHPHDLPKNVVLTPAPICHSSSPELVCQFREAYAGFVAAYRDAMKRLMGQLPNANFPNQALLPGAIPITG